MKKKSSIIKLVAFGVVLVLGFILSVFSFQITGGFYNYKSFASSIKLGLDLKGGVYAVYEADSVGVADFDSALSATQTRLQDLLVNKGYTESVITIENGNRIRVEVPDIDNPSTIFELIGKPAGLEFGMEDAEVDVLLTGNDIVSAQGGYNTSGTPAVALKFTSDGARKFADITTANVNKTMCIYLVTDGVRDAEPISRATITEAIVGGNAEISMSGQDIQAAYDLASRITSGMFEVKLSLAESSTVPPSLGEQALTLGVIAGIIGVVLVMIFLIWRYRLFGVVASLALMLYTELMLFFLAVLPWVQLTLPGIAGIILSIGMAVDGNVVIYERIRDEYANGKSILASVHAGFKKATVAIFDSNITTVIAAIVLLIFGTGSISGFGVTLLIGIILSMFTSLVITRFLCKTFANLNSENPKLYNLKRKAGVSEKPDEVAETVSETAPQIVEEGGNA
ncbi:MAG: protein translocase subunit SecD [Clostridia bacterium]|nr:protein translocase subunit SecD [Clostridia bacterium]